MTLYKRSISELDRKRYLDINAIVYQSEVLLLIAYVNVASLLLWFAVRWGIPQTADSPIRNRRPGADGNRKAVHP